MKNKFGLFSFLLAISLLLSGCSEGEKLLNKLITALNNNDTEEQDGNDSSNNNDVSSEQDDNDGANSNASNSNEGLNVGEAKDYNSDQGDAIELPLGTKSFATAVVDFIVGDPAPADIYANPSNALGEPDFNNSTYEGFVSLGGGGQIIIEFEDAYLVNGPGDDLYIFEVGPAIEAMEIEISTDGINWIPLGEISGGISSIDIEPYLQSNNDRFSFVRVTDLFDNSGGDTSGADIDAIAMMNGILK